MKRDQVLDQIEHKATKKFIVLAWIALIVTLIFLVIMFAFYFLSPHDQNAKVIIIGLIISNFCGVVFSILSYVYEEDDTTFKILVTSINLIIFLIVIACISIIVMDNYADSQM
jgi:predicted permease